MTLQVGVDIGGTFTDTIAIDDSGKVLLSKVPSTPTNQAVGFLSGLRAIDLDFASISWLVHGTTVGTNATLERNGARCGIITTRGFRDIVELGRRDRPQLFGLFGEFKPLVPRHLRLEVSERTDAEGNIVVPLNENEVRQAAITLRDSGVEAVLICFLHSYANSDHEQRAAQIVREVWPNDYITQSAEILGEFREVERFGTAAVNAYIQPLIDRYIGRLKKELREQGVPRDLAIMQANGGIMSADMACRRSVNTVLSGPAAGVIAAAYISKLAAYKNVVTCDMGGTSFDVGLIVDGVPIVTSDRDLAFNLPMRIPIIDIHTIGAGGGSIARINEAGILQVGPKSAGAMPGPIAYGRGGTEPTVTDANVLLGRLASDKLLSVKGGVDLKAVRKAFQDKIGIPLGVSAEEAAAAVLRIVDDAMAGAIRLATLQRGHDPREFAIFAFGGAGPLHGVAHARDLGIPKVIVPYVPGITCALGCIVADVRHDFVQTISRPITDLTESELATVLDQHRTLGTALIEQDKVPVKSIGIFHEADMQYEGQTYTLRVAIERDHLSVEDLGRQLYQAYIDRFGIDLSNFRAKLINLRTAVVGTRPALDLKRIVAATHKSGSLAEARIGSRPIWFNGAFVETPIYQREAVPIGSYVDGPAVFNQMDSTTVVAPGDRVTVDEFGNLIVEVL